MQKIERVQAALHGQPVDRVPVSFWYHFRSDQIAGQAMADAHLAYYRAADPDYLKVMNDTGYELLGIDMLRSPADWRKLRPAPLNSAPFVAQLDGLRRIIDVVGDEAPVLATIFNPFATGNNSANTKHGGTSISFSHITEHMDEDPESVSQGLATIAESLAAFSEACIQAGAAGIFFSANGAEEIRFPAEVFDQYIKPHDLTVLRAAEASEAHFNLLHICGANLRMDHYADYPAHAVNWAPQLGNLSLSAGRQLFQRTIVGGMDQRGVLAKGSRAAITAEAQQALATMGTTGFMLGAGCTVPSNTPIEHFVWAREAVSHAQN